jgi:RNA exonuclease 4
MKSHLVVPELSAEEQATYVAMDCEMVGIGENGRQSSLARVTIVDWNYNTILDKFIRQTEPVTDYRTYVSGITPDDLTSNNAIDLEACREMVLTILKNKCLIGHALKNDLAVLRIRHPWQRMRDTAKYEPFMKVRFIEDGILWPRKLKDLCDEKLKLTIQVQTHSPYEDAVSALKLYQLVRTKWEKVMDYKIRKTAEIESVSRND